MPDRPHAARVELHWLDSCGPPGSDRWIHPSDYKVAPSEIHTRGFIVKETKTYVVVASSLSNSGHMSGMLTIPKCAITKRVDG